MLSFEETALKSAVGPESSVEHSSPRRVLQVLIDGSDHLAGEETADVITLHQPSCGQQLGETVSHAIGIRRHADHGCQPQGHEVPEMYDRKTSQ